VFAEIPIPNLNLLIMASEEERAKILEEYKAAAAAADDDDNEEVDFNPANYDSENDDEFTGEESSDDEEEAIVDPVVLNGTLYINDEGRIIISGTWCLQSQLVTESQDLMCTKPVIKHPKFKLKSQDRVYGTSGPSSLSQSSNEEKKSRRSVLFDIHRPTLSKLPSTESDDNNSIPTRRTMCFDGFFLQPPSPSEADTPAKQQDKKIKERDVEICFTTIANNTSTNVVGRGYNEYGQFVLSNGIYTPPSAGASGSRAKIKFMKTYGSSGDTNTKETRSGAVKRSRRHNDDDSFDDDFDEKADYGEVNELCEDAGLSIEELRAKYYGGGGGGDGDDDDDGGGKVKAASPQMKRARLEEDDDDECGF